MVVVDPGERAEDEHDLARRARRGDTGAFDQLVLRFQRPVYRCCRRMLASRDAEDVAQETFIRAFVHFDRFDLNRPLLPWLIAIARRLCLDRLRKTKLIARALLWVMALLGATVSLLPVMALARTRPRWTS